jgi:hypothetical protein
MKMSETTPNPKPFARAAGAFFLLSLLVPMLNWTLINSKLIVPDNPVETARRVLAHDGLFRLGLVNDLVTSVIAVLLGWTLYRLLESVHRSWALLAFALKAIEGVLLAVVALGNFAVLLVFRDPALVSNPALAQVQELAGLVFDTRMTLAAVPMLFLGLDFTVFLTLLHKSGFVPRRLAGFGVLSYALILVYALLTLLFPGVAAILVVQSLCWAPSCLFELAIGAWLLTKGVANPT